ncbi:hypothetical protein VTL71DRAFT_3596 [Oculimacula yallundae]|uniref:BTB domain-containing protein n=1 Tax=Oculimacula yallundae TaxID=86028 RepID=A0ABR4C9H8_9HELO
MSCKSLKKPKLGAEIGTETVQIGVGVGNKRQTFKVHKSLLQKHTKFFDTSLASETGKNGFIFLNDEDPDIFHMIGEWFYTGELPKPPTQFSVQRPPSEAAMKRLEDDLRARFDAAEHKLIDVYALAEKWDMKDLMNCAIDAIQDGFLEYGTVFGPALLIKIFDVTKPESQLRNLCIAVNVIHTDRGCCKLRQELAFASMAAPGFMSAMLTWISRNFVLIARRANEGYDVRKPREGFSPLNRKSLCPCHFHTHGPGEAHKKHKQCAIPYNKCGHEQAEEAGGHMEPNPMDVEINLNRLLDRMSFNINGAEYKDPAGRT